MSFSFRFLSVLDFKGFINYSTGVLDFLRELKSPFFETKIQTLWKKERLLTRCITD